MRFPRAILCLVLATVAATSVALLRVRAQTVTLEPFVGIQVREMSWPKQDPPISRTDIETIAVRSDGSIASVSEWDRSPGGVRYSRYIIDAASKTDTVVDPVTESIVAEPYNDVQLIGRGSCEGAPADPVEGFDVVYSESTDTTAYGSTITMKEWKAPALGCYAIETEIISKDGNGDLIGHTETSLVHIKLGDPDPWYFSIPTTYTARTPKEFQALIEPMFHK